MINISELDNAKEYIEILHRVQAYNTSKLEVIGAVSILIYSKDIFKKNKDINSFIVDVLQLQYPEYIMKSRTLIVAKVSRYIYLLAPEELLNISSRINTFFDIKEFSELKEIDKIKPTNKKMRKKNENDKLDTWLKGL